jgi:hypothetical protein
VKAFQNRFSRNGGSAGTLQEAAPDALDPRRLYAIREALERIKHPNRRDLLASAADALAALQKGIASSRKKLTAWRKRHDRAGAERYGTYLYSNSAESALKVPAVAAVYSDESPPKLGFEILNACFDAAFARYPQLVAMGEDIGRLGDVNQGFAGLQSVWPSAHHGYRDS